MSHRIYRVHFISDCLGPLGNKLRVESEPSFSTFEQGIDDNEANLKYAYETQAYKTQKKAKIMYRILLYTHI